MKRVLVSIAFLALFFSMAYAKGNREAAEKSKEPAQISTEYQMGDKILTVQEYNKLAAAQGKPQVSLKYKDVVIPEKYRFGEAVLTEAEYNRLAREQRISVSSKSRTRRADRD